MKNFSEYKKNPKDIIKVTVAVVDGNPSRVGAYAYILSYNNGARTIIKSGHTSHHDRNVEVLENYALQKAHERINNKHKKHIVIVNENKKSPLYKMAMNHARSTMNRLG